MPKYINAEDLLRKLGSFVEYDDDGEQEINPDAVFITIYEMPAADVVEVEPLKTYITTLTSSIPQTDYVKDDYDAGFADALNIIYAHLCGADIRERKETNDS